MNDLNPGDGWREVDTADDHDVRLVERGGRVLRAWVRVLPLPLPTEPYTVIRVEWGLDYTSDMVLRNGGWHSLVGGAYPDSEIAHITGFEVLSEPRAVTAKAVIERVRGSVVDEIGALDDVAEQFGVDA